MAEPKCSVDNVCESRIIFKLYLVIVLCMYECIVKW